MMKSRITAETIISQLDDLARDFDNYEYGLPTYNDKCNEEIVACVSAHIDEHAQSLAKEVVDVLEGIEHVNGREYNKAINNAIELIKAKFQL